MHPLAPVVAIDIDGTLGDYHEHFRRFAEQYTGRQLRLDWQESFHGKFYKALHMGKPLYREIKLAYRQGGQKRSMPAFPCARELTVDLRKAGAQVWICTTRPYLRLDSIDPDTRHWLYRHGIQYDGILYGERKYRDLVDIVGRHRVLAVVDDLPEQIEAAAKIGLHPVHRRGPHNLWFRSQHDQVYNLREAQVILHDLVDKWKADNGDTDQRRRRRGAPDRSAGRRESRMQQHPVVPSSGLDPIVRSQEP